MNDKHIYYNEIVAYASGKKVQYRNNLASSLNRDWQDFYEHTDLGYEMPNFNAVHLDWRVKPTHNEDIAENIAKNIDIDKIHATIVAINFEWYHNTTDDVRVPTKSEVVKELKILIVSLLESSRTELRSRGFVLERRGSIVEISFTPIPPVKFAIPLKGV